MKLNHKLNISHKGILLVSVPLISELFFVAILVFMLQQAELEINRAVQAKTIVQHADAVVVEVMKTMGSLQAAKQNEQNSSAPKDALRNDYMESRARAEKEFATLARLVDDRPMQVVLVKKIQDRSHACYDMIEQISELEQHHPDLEHRVSLYNSRQRLNEYFSQILNDLDTFSSKERKVEAESPALQTGNRQRFQIVLIAGIFFNIILALALAIYFSRGIAGRLMVINQNSRNLANGKPLMAPLDGSDEIANVDRVFHTMAAKLKELDEMKRDFVAMVSHDLRTPLTSLQAFLTLLESGVLEANISEKTKARARGAEEDVARLIRLINELLDVEKMERGNVELKVDSLSIKELLLCSVESVKAAAEQKHVRINMSDVVDVRIIADRDRLIQVIVNLLSNAIKFSSDNSNIDLSAKSVQDLVEIRVTDHGRGIPQSALESVFDRFRQVELTDATEKGGSGLGLTICKAIIEKHGGTIGVDSAGMGKGASFWFRLPREVSLF
jgi:signal transduction histidine kinase